MLSLFPWERSFTLIAKNYVGSRNGFERDLTIQLKQSEFLMEDHFLIARNWKME